MRRDTHGGVLGIQATDAKQVSVRVRQLAPLRQRQIARLCGRLEGLKRLAESATAAVGEREDAEREFAREQTALQALFRSEQKFETLF